MIILYQVFLILFLPPILILRALRGKFRGNFLSRFGFGFPNIQKGDRKLIWLHAVSLGETKAVVAFAKKMKEKWDNPCLVVSSMTETGHNEAKKAISFADAHVLLPFDFYCVIYPIINKLCPDLLVISETDFWPNLILSAKKRGAKIALINGKLSEKTTNRYSKLRVFTKPLWKQIDLYCVQSETYRKRFQKVGVPLKKLAVTGNLKFDKPVQSCSEEKVLYWKDHFGFKEDDLIIVVGSTHDPEEKIFLKTFEQVRERFPNLKMVLAPRRPERFDEVESIMIEYGLPPVRYSKLIKNQLSAKSILLIDQMGLLDHCYQIADIAVVGGSYSPIVGGHNILEPASQGTAVIFGPYMHAQPDLVSYVNKYGAGKQVSEADLACEISYFFKEKKQLKEMGLRGRLLMQDLQGSTDLTVDLILSLLSSK